MRGMHSHSLSPCVQQACKKQALECSQLPPSKVAAHLFSEGRALMRQRRGEPRIRLAHTQAPQGRARFFFICLTGAAARLRLSRAQRRMRRDSLVAAGCPGRRGPVPLARRGRGGRSSVTGVSVGGVVLRPPLVGLVGHLGRWSCRSTLRAGGVAASAA